MARSTKIFRLAAVPAILLIALWGYGIRQKGNQFDTEVFNVENVLDNIEILSSPLYAGRLPGSEGNTAAAEYIAEYFESLGLDPAGDEGSYFQTYSTVVPQIDSQPIFTVGDPGSETFRDFTMYQDYRAMVSGNGAGIDFYGEMLLAGPNLAYAKPSDIRGRIVVVESLLVSPKKADFVLENGGRGVLFVSDATSNFDERIPILQEKDVTIAQKTGARFLLGNLSVSTYKELKKRSGNREVLIRDFPSAIVGDVRIKIDITFPVLEAVNVAGCIPGRGRDGRILLITAEFDGSGEGVDGTYFPGALNGSSGAAIMMELARVAAAGQSRPYRSLVFTAFNGRTNQSSGTRYYTQHPLYPLEDTTVIHLEGIGAPYSQITTIASGSEYGEILASKLSHFASEKGLGTQRIGLTVENAVNSFVEHNVPVVLISSNKSRPDTLEDTPENLSSFSISDASALLLNFLKVEVFRDRSVRNGESGSRIYLVILIAILGLNYFIVSTYNTFPNLNYRGLSIENIYYHWAPVGMRKMLFNLFPAALALLLLVFIITLPYDGSIENVNGKILTNYSGYLSSRRMYGFLNAVFGSESAAKTAAGRNSLTIIQAGIQSLKLISVSLLLSMLIGISRGIIESRSRGWLGAIRTTESLLIASVPDVAVIIGIMWLYVFSVAHFPEWNKKVDLRSFILPLISLSVLPISYISRISFITIQNESRKDYVRFAKAKGLSGFRILTRELYPSVISSVLDSVPTLMTMMLTNLIVIEYLFNYKGIIFYLLFFYQRHDSLSFVILAISVGGLYLLFAFLSQSFSRLTNPMKRKQVQR